MCSNKRSHGFTLLEMIVAMFIAGIVIVTVYSFFISFHRSAFTRELRNNFIQEANFFSSSIKNRIMTGKGILEVSEERIKIIDLNNRELVYSFEDDNLLLNEKKVNIAVICFKIHAIGPVLETSEYVNSFRKRTPLEWLDMNGNRVIDMEELDTDISGYIEGEECAYIGLINIEIEYKNRDFTLKHRFKIHPRNRL
ncbi:MAG: prepilin-type N-terminal cleavage/methylation domain-containing protein [Fibrobacteria bacterium]|nr:prepilin-type N-terminal cleavage/methylation domain-containing protein [Fibrobacteria bacterium]